MSRRWSDKEGSLSSDDDIDARVHQILERLDPQARRIVGQAGRRYCDDIAERYRRQQLDRESSHDISDAYFARGGVAQAQAERLQVDRVRRIAADRDTPWQGRQRMTEAEQEQWVAQAWPDHHDVDLPTQRDDDTHVQEASHG